MEKNILDVTPRREWLRNSSLSLLYQSKEVKAEVILCIFLVLVCIFGTNLAQNLWW
jgi:hypothetical protein